MDVVTTSSLFYQAICNTTMTSYDTARNTALYLGHSQRIMEEHYQTLLDRSGRKAIVDALLDDVEAVLANLPTNVLDEAIGQDSDLPTTSHPAPPKIPAKSTHPARLWPLSPSISVT